MTLSILLTAPWDAMADDFPPRLEVPKVRSHRFSWKGAGTVGFPRDAWHVVPQRRTDGDDGGVSDEAEVIVPAPDESLFHALHAVIAKDVDYDGLSSSVTDARYAGIVDVIREMATQHPDAMWFVREWVVESDALD
jgi:hypothetical protein